MPDARVVEIHGSRFVLGDCVEAAREHVPDGSVDLIITDPPYGIGGDKLHRVYNRNETFVKDAYHEVPAEAYAAFTHAWLAEAARMLRPGGAIFVVSGYTRLLEVLQGLRDVGLREVNHLVWRYSFGVYTSRKFVSSHYHILYYEKPGGPRTFDLECRFGLEELAPDGGNANYQDRETVWAIPREYKHGREKNKNELPTALLVKMIQYASRPGDVVADLFLGGFSTARAAVGPGRRAVGFEINPQAFELGVRRMERVDPGELLPTLRTPTPLTGRTRARSVWSPTETAELASSYRRLRDKGYTKGDAVESLKAEFQRGRWAILKALKRNGVE